MITTRKYWLLQIPGWLLGAAVVRYAWGHTGWPAWTAALALFVWVAKDFALFPLVKSAYETDMRGERDKLIGRRAVARDGLAPDGFVILDGARWRAQLETAESAVPAGAPVVVKAVEPGLKLVVAPHSDLAEAPGEVSGA